MRIVYGLITSIEVHGSVPTFFPRTASRFHFAASASKSVPSWNLTPFLNVNVIELLSGATFQEVASHGMGFPSGLSLTSASIQTGFDSSIVDQPSRGQPNGALWPTGSICTSTPPLCGCNPASVLTEVFDGVAWFACGAALTAA